MILDPCAIRALEERSFNAWPALATVLADGWVLRFSDGYTKRANSVNALAPRVPLERVLDFAAPLYARRGQPLIVRLTPLAGARADAELEARGFRKLDASLVMTAPIGSGSRTVPNVAILSEPDTDWLAGFAAANRVPPEHRATHDRMVGGLRLPVAFASCLMDGEPVAWGLAVADRGFTGLFDIVTKPSARRQGVARALVSALMLWGGRQGATRAYLQVVADNIPARTLYASLGFTEAYGYHYRVKP